MFNGYYKSGVLIGFISTFLLEFVLFQNTGWPRSAVVLAALAPLFVGLAFFTHGAGRPPLHDRPGIVLGGDGRPGSAHRDRLARHVGPILTSRG